MEDQVSLWFKLSNEEIMDHSKYRNINTKYAQREITTINHYMFKIDWLIDWCLMPTLAVCQLYRGANQIQ